MQAIGNTSAKQETKLATNGRYAYESNLGADFASMLSTVKSSLSQSDSLQSICSKLSESIHAKLSENRQRSGRGDAINSKTDAKDSRSAFLESKRNLKDKTLEIKEDTGENVSLDERKDCRQENADPSVQLEKVVFDEVSNSDIEFVAPSSGVVYEDNGSDGAYLQKNGNSVSVTVKTPITAFDNKTQVEQSEFSADDLEKLKAFFTELSEEEITEDQKQLTPSELDSFLKEKGAVNDLISSLKHSQVKTDTAALNQTNQLGSSNAVTDPDLQVGDWMKALLDEAKVESVKVENNKSAMTQTDFGADDFDLIEQSLKASALMDEKLSKSDVKAKIDSIMDSKEEALSSTLEKSLELLRSFSAKGSSENVSAAVSARGMLSEGLNSNQKGADGSLSQSLEKALMMQKSVEGSISASAETSHLGKESGNSQSNGQSADFGMLMGQQSKIELSKAYAKTEQLMNMSSNLKANAQALTEKVMQMAAKNQKVLHLNLNPEGMGKMKISIDCTGADEITRVSVSASSLATRAVLEQGMDALKQALRDNNITAQAEVTDYEDFTASDSEQSFKDNEQQSREGNGGLFNGNNGSETLFASDDSEQIESNNSDTDDSEYLINSQNGDTVSYFA
ncbi:MAG: flagellar hook-length control protein FliK [Succinivibrio sp.]